MVLPTIGTKLYWILGSVLFGGLIYAGVASSDTTSTSGHSVVLPEFASATTLRPVTGSTSSGFPYKVTVNAYVRGTGSTTLRYSASCIRNPLKGMGAGSGIVARLDYHVGNNPNGLGGDIGFVKNCSNHGVGVAAASGSDLINDVATATGATSSYTTGTATFNDADFIKFTPRGNLGSSYTGRITLEVINIWGE